MTEFNDENWVFGSIVAINSIFISVLQQILYVCNRSDAKINSK
jgi:hypothetical protein